MAERKPPETSTVRSALAALGAIEDALDVRRPEQARLLSIADAIRNARELRGHQLDELLEHLDTRVGHDGSDVGTDDAMEREQLATPRPVRDSPQA